MILGRSTDLGRDVKIEDIIMIDCTYTMMSAAYLFRLEERFLTAMHLRLSCNFDMSF